MPLVTLTPSGEANISVHLIFKIHLMLLKNYVQASNLGRQWTVREHAGATHN